MLNFPGSDPLPEQEKSNDTVFTRHISDAWYVDFLVAAVLVCLMG